MNVQILSVVIATATVEFCQEMTALVNRNVEVLSTIENPSHEVTTTLAFCNEVLSLCANRIATATEVPFLSEGIATQSVEFCQELSALLNRNVEILSTIETPSVEILSALAHTREVSAICVNRIATATATPCLNQVVATQTVEFCQVLTAMVNRSVEILSTIATPSEVVVETLAFNREILTICETRIASASAHAHAHAHAHTHATETETAE
jgi:hypothetical protein